MANGLSINGVVQGMGFGFTPWSSGQVPTQYVGAVSRSRKFEYTGNAAVRSLCQGELIPGVGSPSAFAPANTCGIEGSMACAYGSPESSFSGLGGSLGGVSNFICGDWADIMTQMQVLLAKAEERGQSTPAYNNARQYFDANTGVFQKPIFSCGSHTETAKAFYNALNTELGFVGPSVSATINPTDPSSPNFKPPGESEMIASAVKWGAIAVACLAGAYALGPLFRGIGGLIPSRKR